MADKNSFYVTTPIYYPNGEPHLGSLYTTTICDALARYHRLRGQPTFFLTGTDEHGTKMAKAAAAEGLEPLQLADRYVKIYRDTWREFQITNDDFIRTTDDRHKRQVQEIVRRLVASDDIYAGSYEGWYDEGQEEFVTETDAKARDFKSAISGKPLTRYQEKSYFFRLSKYVPRLLAHIEANEHFIKPETRRNEVISKLKAGVSDLSISRASLKWGVPLPNDPDHVLYVWIDALSNYITGLGYADSDNSKYKQFWPGINVIGKDILWFHSVYWPALLFALGEPPPRTVAAHGWWVSGGKKAGKSTGGLTTLAELREFRDLYSLDALRYHLLRATPFGSDAEWSDEELKKSFNELANIVGNCLNRTVKMVGRYRGGVLPESGEVEQTDRELLELASRTVVNVEQAYEKLELQQCALLPIELARATNGYIDSTAPFTLAKDPAKTGRLDTVLNLSAQAIHRALILLLPILPEKATTGLLQLGIDPAGKSLPELLKPLAAGQKFGEGQPLFPKIDAPKA